MWADIEPAFVERLIREGRHFGPSDRIAPGATPNNCHGGSLDWATKRGGTVWSGFALSEDDDFWRVHSWAVDKKGLVVECTPCPRVAYFGVPIRTLHEMEIWAPSVVTR
jgi:hypothetical protein